MLSLQKFELVVGYYWVSGEPIAILYVCLFPVEDRVCGYKGFSKWICHFGITVLLQ
jgi:hypothetical protein